MDKPSPPQRGSWWSIPIALFAVLGLFALFFFLALPLAPVVLTFGGLVLAFGLIGLFHYVVWGWWLSPILRAEVEEEQRARERDELSEPK